MEQGKIMEAEVPTVWVGAHPHNPPRFFYRPDALPAAQPTASKHSSINIQVVSQTANEVKFR